MQLFVIAPHKSIRSGTAFHTNITNDSIEGALPNIRNKLTDGRCNLSNFEAVQRVRGDVSDMAQSAAQSGYGNKAHLLRGYFVNSINRWKTPVKDFFKLIVISLKRRVILRPYRQAVRRQHAGEAKTLSPHIRHFGLKARPRFAPDM